MINRLILIIAGLIYITGIVAQPATTKRDINLDDIFKSWNFYPASIEGITSMADGLNYTILEGDSAVAKYSFITGKKIANIFTVQELNNPEISNFQNYQFSNDESKIIFYIRRQNIYRRSFIAEYYVWDLITKKLYPVSAKSGQRLATLSPDGTKAADRICSNCGDTEGLIYEEGCLKCKSCGYAKCG